MSGFQFKQFTIHDDRCEMKVGTDGVLLGAWVGLGDAKRALDIGTGSGVIAMMMAQRKSDLIIDGVEVREQDAQQAASNVEGSPWRNRIHIHHAAIQEYEWSDQYDVIASNPPFFVNSTLPPATPRASVRHTLTLSHEHLLKSVSRFMKSDGRFSIILPSTGHVSFLELAQKENLFPRRTLAFHTREDRPAERHLIELGFGIGPLSIQQMFLYSGKGQRKEDWSDDYRRLVSDFYL